MHVRTPSILFPSLLGASLVACGQPTAQDYDDVAASVSALVSDVPGGEAEAMSDAIMISQGALPSGMTRAGSGNLTGRRGQLDYDFQVTCQDATGSTLATCDGTTDSARLVLAWSGEVDTARWSASLERSGDWTVVGLQSAEAEIDGTGSFSVDSEFTALRRTERRTLQYDYEARYEDVKVRTADRVITSGRARFEVHANRTRARGAREVEASFDITAEVTFLGNGQATLVLDGARSYRVDLATATVTAEE